MKLFNILSVSVLTWVGISQIYMINIYVYVLRFRLDPETWLNEKNIHILFVCFEVRNHLRRQIQTVMITVLLTAGNCYLCGL